MALISRRIFLNEIVFTLLFTIMMTEICYQLEGEIIVCYRLDWRPRLKVKRHEIISNKGSRHVLKDSPLNERQRVRGRDVWM